MAKREKAPKVRVKIDYVDKRAEKIKALNREHPEYIHMYQNVDAEESEMRNSYQEWVKNNTYNEKGNGDVMTVRNDGIARVPKEIYDEMRELRTEQSADLVESIYCNKNTNENWEDNSPGRRIANPKDPTKIGKTGGY